MEDTCKERERKREDEKKEKKREGERERGREREYEKMILLLLFFSSLLTLFPSSLFRTHTLPLSSLRSPSLRLFLTNPYFSSFVCGRI